MAALADADRTILVLVARPERVALLEAERTSRELRALGIRNQHLVINGVFRATDRTDSLALAVEARAQSALAQIPRELAALPSAEVPLRGHNVVGLAAVRDFLQGSQNRAARRRGSRHCETSWRGSGRSATSWTTSPKSRA
jgi:arsenite-transporting ATPase